MRAELVDEQRRNADHRIEQRQSAEDAGTERKAGAKADDQNGPRRGRRILLDEADETQHQDHHRHRKWRILRVHEHVPVEGRAERKQKQGRQSGKRTADTAAEPPRHRQPDDTDDGADQAARFEQLERDDLVQQRGGHIEAAAIHIEIGKRQRAGVLETGTVHAQQQVGIFGVGVVVPAQPIVPEGEACDQAHRDQRDDGEVVADPLHRARERRIDGRRRNG